MLTDRLLKLTLAGGSEWVMILLILLSLASVAVMVERALVLRRRRRALDAADATLAPLLRQRKLDAVERAVEASGDDTLRAAVAAGGEPEPEAAERLVQAALVRERLGLEQRLTFLGTLGSNAPFVGLLGTVLGIIRAFHDLSVGSMKGHASVMSGISEALVATALGLFVAIPAVVAYNYFQKQVDRILSVSESLALAVLARQGGEGAGGPYRGAADRPKKGAG